MADNVTFQDDTPSTPADGTIVASKEVSFSGDTSKVQLLEIVAVTGSEGSRTLNEISDASGLKIQDGGNTITVDGTVAVTHAALTELAAAIDTEVQVDVVSSALPSGASTSAKQDTEITALQAIQAAVETLDNFISGSKGLVTEDNSAAILTAVQIIDNFISGSRGLVTEDNSAAMLTALQVIDNFISGSRGLVTEDNSAAALTALQLIDDTVATLGTTTYTEATTKGLVVGAVRRDADTSLVDTTNEIGPLQMNAAGQLKVEAFSGETLPVSLASVPSHAVTNAGTFAVQVDSSTLPSGAATSAKQDTQITAEQAIQTAAEIMDDWDESDRAKVNPIVGQAGVAAGAGNVGATVQRVVIATDQAQLTNALKVDGSAVTQPVSLTSTTVTGTVAVTQSGSWDEVGINDSGNSITVDNGGTFAVQPTTTPRSQSGPGQPGTAVDSYTHAAINLTAGNNQVLVSSAASKQIWVYGIGFTLSVAGSVSFQDEDDTAITGIMPFAALSGMAVPPSGNFSMPIWKLATDKDLEVDLVTADMDGWIDYAILSV